MTDTLRNILSKVPVVPVLTVHGPEDAVPLARALVAGGLTVLEITLRTEGALKAIEALARDVPEAMIGAGTVLTPSQISEAMSAGAGFIVSPGSTVKLAEAAQHQNIPFLPGVATASEAMLMAELGHHVLKFSRRNPRAVSPISNHSVPLCPISPSARRAGSTRRRRAPISHFRM